MDYETEIKNLREKVGKLCNTVEMECRIELREVKKDQKQILNMMKEILAIVGGDK